MTTKIIRIIDTGDAAVVDEEAQQLAEVYGYTDAEWIGNEVVCGIAVRVYEAS